MHKTALPPYAVEPPDILLLDVLRVVPKPPYRIEPLDALLLQATNALPQEPIQGVYGVEPNGTINLGLSYGAVRVVGLTLEEAREAIEKQVSGVLTKPKVLVSLAQARGLQQIRGEHLVRPDGTVGLGSYGSVYVAGMTLDEARHAIESHLAASLLQPEISLDVFAYNSKFYYIVTDGAGFGQQVVRLPVTGNETVLDAISQIYGLPQVASTRHIWVARPSDQAPCGYQVLRIDWQAIVECGAPQTNYQVLPGDRIYVKADSLITLDNALAKIISPIERIFGVTLLGNTTVKSFDQRTYGNTGTGTGF